MPASIRAWSIIHFSESHKKKRDILAFTLRLCLFAGFGLGFYYLGPTESFVQEIARLLALTVGGFLRLLGIMVNTNGAIVYMPGVFGIDITPGCSGLPFLILFLSAILAYPTTNKARLVGVALSTSVILCATIIRMLSLILLGIAAREYFDFAHSFGWRILNLVGMIIIWKYWLHRFAVRSTKNDILQQEN